MAKFVVTPWEVTGDVNYDKLVKDFGTTRISKQLLEKTKKHTGKLHLFLRRGLFFSHRDFDKILDDYEKGNKFFLYTGRGPSGKTHLGHLIPWIFAKHLQDKFKAEMYFQLTDDEKYLVKNLTLDQTIGFSYDNALDVIACGFNPKKTFIFLDTEYSKSLYKMAIRISKHITFSITKSVFGFQNSSNIGLIFFPAMQAAPCFFPSELKKKKMNCLIPAAIDQDPYWRGIARYVAPKLGYPKPAQIHNKFLPGLGESGKMSSSKPNTCIFTTDDPDIVKKKIWNAFTGGRGSKKEQMEKGGNPDICKIYQYLYYMFEEDDKKLKERYNNCKKGKILCGDCKIYLTNKINKFLKEHQKRRQKAKKQLDKFILRD